MHALLYVTLCPFSELCNHLDAEKKAGCYAQFVFLLSRDCCVALPRGAMGLSAFVIVVFPDHTHYFSYMRKTKAQNSLRNHAI